MNRDQIVESMCSFWLENFESLSAEPVLRGDRDDVRRRMYRLFDEVVSPNMNVAKTPACVPHEGVSVESPWASKVVKKFLRRC